MYALAGAETQFPFGDIQLSPKAPEADDKTIVLNWNLTDGGEKYVLSLENSAITYSGPLAADKPLPPADATLNLTRATLDAINTGQMSWKQALTSGKLIVTGNPQRLFELLGLLNTKFDPMFNIVTP